MKNKFTALGTTIWSWEPWCKLESLAARMVWLALYTTAESKRLPPGLWHGSIYTLAEAANMLPDDVRTGIDVLLEHELVEFDQAARVIRLTSFPDACERAHNGKHVRGWFAKFITVPQCAVRDAHIRALRWLLDQGAVTEDHRTAWDDTFGSVAVPVPRKRGVRRLANNDTSTSAQQSLFAPRVPSMLAVEARLQRAVDTVSVPLPELPPASAVPTPTPGVVSSEKEPGIPNEINKDRYSIGYSIPYCMGPDPDPGLDLSSTGSGAGGATDHGSAPVVPGSHLTLVPPPLPCSLAEVVAAVTGRVLPLHPEVTEGLQRALRSAVAMGVAGSVVEDLRAWSRDVVDIPPQDVLRWLTDPSSMLSAIASGAEQRGRKQARSSAMSEYLAHARAQAGV